MKFIFLFAFTSICICSPLLALGQQCQDILAVYKSDSGEWKKTSALVYPSSGPQRVAMDEVKFVISKKKREIAGVLAQAGYVVFVHPRNHIWNISGVHPLEELSWEGLDPKSKPDFVISDGTPMVFASRYFDLIAPSLRWNWNLRRIIRASVEARRANRFVVDMRGRSTATIQAFISELNGAPPEGLIQVLIVADSGVELGFPFQADGTP